MVYKKNGIKCILVLAAYIAALSFCIGAAALTSINNIAEYYATQNLQRGLVGALQMLFAVAVATVGNSNIENIYQYIIHEGESK